MISRKDYIICYNGKKKVLAKVDATGSTIQATVSNHNMFMKDTKEIIEVKKDDILCNLGKRPEVGSAYGVSVEPFREHFTHKIWGDIFVFRDLTDSERNYLIKKLDRKAKILRKTGK